MTALIHGQTSGGRVAHFTSRLMEFFTQAELTMQLGHARELWPLAVIKELVDNGLDAAEAAGIAPRIVVTISDHAISVADNGPGLPASVLASSLDYGVRVSDKNHYVAPTRGQLGNGLKCVWAAPFVWAGAEAQVEVQVGAALTTIGVTLDRIAQEPRVTPCRARDHGRTEIRWRLDDWPGKLRLWPATPLRVPNVRTSGTL